MNDPTLARALIATDAAMLSATPATLATQIKAARPGDVVQLQAGAYGVLNLSNIVKAAPGITIMPAPGAAVAVSSVVLNGSANLTVDGMDVAMTPTTQYGVQTNGQSIALRNMTVHQADNHTLSGVGFFVRNAQDVTIDNADVSWVENGAAITDSVGVTITASRFHDQLNDVIDLAGASNTTIRGNTASDSHPSPTGHPDFIQWYATAKTPAPCGLVIENNRFDRGAGGASQGIFGSDVCNVTIKGNVLRGTMGNGIALARTKGAVITGNFVQGYPDMDSRIVVRNACDKVQIADNAAQAVVNYVASSEPPCANVTMAGNTVVTSAAMGDDRQLTGWQAFGDRDARIAALKAQIADLEAQLAALQ